MDSLLDQSVANEKYAFQENLLKGKIPRVQWVQSDVHMITVINAEIAHLAIAASTIMASRFVGARFLKGEILGATFQHCLFQNVIFEDVVFREVEFSHCTFSNCTWKDTTAEGLPCAFSISQGLFLSGRECEALASCPSITMKECVVYEPEISEEAPKRKISAPAPESVPKTEVKPPKEETRFAGLEI